MVGPTDVVQPPVPRAARARDAWLCHVSSVGGARRCGCAAAGAPEFFNGLLDAVMARPRRPRVIALVESRPARPFSNTHALFELAHQRGDALNWSLRS